MDASGGDKVRVRFVTSHDSFRVTDSPFVIPQKLGRYGLSEVVNHLLSSNSDSAQPFDFSINGVLLRSQLKTFLRAHRTNLEEIVTIEYQPALSLSDESEVLETPAWVGSLSTEISSFVFAGCYDGSIQIARSIGQDTVKVANSQDSMLSISAHDGQPIRAIAAWGAGEVGGAFLATGSKDLTVKLWRLEQSSTSSSGKKKGKGEPNSKNQHPPTLTQTAEMVGHFNSVESLGYWGDQGVLLSGDWAGNIFGWNVSKAGDWAEDQDSQSESSRKRIKNDTGGRGSLRELKAAFTLRAHSQAVSSVRVGAQRVFTASWDHSIKAWDMQAQDCVETVVSNKVVTCLDVQGGGGEMLLSAHPDGKARIWDMRQNGGNGCGVYSSSTVQWVSAAAWHPSIETVFASADYAGIVRIWDTRSSTAPLSSTEAHDGKALCCAWEGQGDKHKLLSGGSDCKISSYLFGSV